MIQELKKLLPKKKRFKNRMQMLHFVASTDYEDGVIYYTDGGKTWFYNDRLYRNNNCVGYVDRDAEQICRNISLEENTSLWIYSRELFDAFKHYEQIDLTSFNGVDAFNILDKSFVSITSIKAPTYYHSKAYVLAYKTVLFLSSCPDPTEEMTKQYKKSLKFILAEDKKTEKERKMREKAQKAFDKKCLEISKKYTKGILIGKDWNTKLKNFCRTTRKVYITVEEWKELNEFTSKSPFYCSLFGLASPDWVYVDGHSQVKEYPENPYINFSSLVLNRIKSLSDYADFLYLDNDHIKTTRSIDINDSSKLIRNLLKRFVNSSDEARHKFIGLHVGSFVIREWNPEQRYLQIGCHRFYEQTLIEFADYCEKGK